MTTFNQDEFQASKDALDKMIARAGKLADAAWDAMVHCCRCGEVDARDQFAALSAELREAQAHLTRARSIGGGIQTGDGVITRGGST